VLNAWFERMEGAPPPSVKRANEIRKRGFSADVYAPYAENKYYAVVIGAQLTLSQARQIRQDARLKGLPDDTYLWTFPQN
jgi:hypothetical protein